MKKLIILLAMVFILGCGNNQSLSINEELKMASIELSYNCAELGYNYALVGKSKSEMFTFLATVIGERPTIK